MNINDYFKSIEGISYLEWIKLSQTVNRYFDLQAEELKNKIQLLDLEKLKDLNRSLFG